MLDEQIRSSPIFEWPETSGRRESGQQTRRPGRAGVKREGWG